MGDRLTFENYGIAFRQGNYDMHERVNKEILTLQEDGYLQLLNDKWFGEDEG